MSQESVLKLLEKNPTGLTTSELQAILKLSRSVVFTALNRMLKYSEISREQTLTSSGHLTYTYRAKEEKWIKKN